MAGWEWVAKINRRDDRRIIDRLLAMPGAVVGASRPAVSRLMMVLALIAGVLAVSSPVQAAGESYSGSGTGIYRRYAGDYLITADLGVLFTGNSQVNEEMVSYATFTIPANKSYSSVNLSHAHGCNYGAGAQISFSLLTSRPASNGAGITEIRASTRFGGVVAGAGASVDSLPGSVVTEMNRLSAAGGGMLYLGVYAGTSASVLCGFSTFNLVGEITSPAISSVSPNRGPAAGGGAITISGSNLNGATSVTFGGAAGTNISASANEISVTAPAGSPGAVDVVVTTPGGSATASGAYTYIVGPAISSVSPNTGATAGGYTVTLNGTNLINATSVTFGGVPGGIGTRRPNSLEVTMPALATPRTVDVVVTGPGGTATLVNGFTAVAAPTIASVSPNQGSRGGGQTVTITGTNLTGAGAVSFGGAAGSNIVVDSATQLRVTTPVRFDGAMDVTVTTPGGTATLAGGYTFVSPSVTITSPADGGTVTTSTVTVSGTAANATAVEVFLNAVSQGSVTVVNGAWSKVLSGSLGNGTYTVLVQASDGRVPSPLVSAAFTVAVAPPQIFDRQPSGGPAGGGFTVVITGVNFTGATGVTFGNTPATGFTVDSDTRITAIVPAGSGHIDLNVTTPGGSSVGGSSATSFLYIPAPTISAVSPNTGSTSGSQAVTITGADLDGATSVTFGSAPGVIIGGGATELQVITPAHAAGVVNVVVSAAGGTTTRTNGYTYAAAPTANAFTAAPVAYNSGAASPSPIELSAHVSGVASNYFLSNGLVGGGLITTAQGGRASVNIATGHVDYTPPVGFRGADTFQYSVDAGGQSGWATVTVPVNDPVFTVTLPEATGAAGAPYNGGGAAVTVSGGAAPYSNFAATGLPAGLTMNGAGVISGTPTTTFNGIVGITFTDSSTGQGPFPASAMGSLSIEGPTLTVTPTMGALPGARVHSAYSQTFIPGGGTPAYRFELLDGDLPGGLTLSTAGVLSGTPTRTGTFNFTVRLRDSSGGGSWATDRAYSLEVGLPLPPTAGAVTTTVAANSSGNVITPSLSGTPTDSVAVAGGPTHGAVTVSGLTFLYTPTAGYSGVDSFTYIAVNAGGDSAPVSATVTVLSPVLTLGGLAPATGTATTSYSAALIASLGTAPYSCVVSGGALPTGLSLSTGGALSGTPTVAGAFTFEVRATDAYGAVGTRSYTLDLSPPTITLTPAAGALPGGLRTVAYSQTFIAAGGAGPYGYTVTLGALPSGLALTSEGALSGTPTVAGSYGFTVTARDAYGFSQAAAYTLEIGTPVPVVQSKTVTVVGGHSVAIDAAEGATGLDLQTAQVVTGPAHGTVAVNGLVITYVADGAYAGPDSFTYTVSNPGGPSAPATVSITVNPAVVAGPVKTTTILAGRTATVELTEGATGSPFTGAAVVSVGPTGAGTATVVPRIGQGGVQLYDLVFTPADAFTGEATVLYTLSNAFATSAPGTVAVTVEARPDPGLDPEVRGVATGQVTAARRFADAQINNFQRRLQALRDGDNGSSSGLSLNLGFGDSADEDLDPRAVLRRELGQPSPRLDPGALNDGRDREMLGLDLWADRSQIDPAGPSPIAGDRLNAGPAARADGSGHPVGFWTAGAVDWGRQDADGQRDYRFTTQGVTVGLDVRVNDSLIVGGGLGYGEDRTRIGDNGSLTEGSAFTGALYASWRPAEAFYIDGVLGHARLDFSSHRWVQGVDDQPDSHADGDRSGEVLFASAALGRVIRRHTLVSDLYARIDAREIALDAFTERGGGLAALTWEALDQSSLSANLGASLRWAIETRRHGRLLPSARLEWSHELENIGDQGVRYADWAASPTYLVPLDAWSRDAINLDLGLEWSLTDRLMFSLGYRSLFGDASSSQGGQIRLRYGW